MNIDFFPRIQTMQPVEAAVSSSCIALAEDWLPKLKRGDLSPESCFALMQGLPPRHKSAAEMDLLHVLSGEQVLYALL